MEVILSHLSKAYGGIPVLTDFSCTLTPGVTCLMAPSGAGKTTLLRLLLGLETPDSGQILGLDHARISAVFQEDRLLMQWNGRDNLRFVLGVSYDEAAAQTLLEQLGLDLHDDKPAASYSGGMRRRLALARALLVPFDVLVLDEPFTGLDAENRARAIRCIQQVSAGKLVLLVTHDPADADAFGAQVLPFANFP